MTELRTLNTHYAATDFGTRAAWQRYARWLKRHTAVSLALSPPPPRTPLRARVFGRYTGAGYTCAKVSFESMPGYCVTGNLYRPAGDAGAGRRPAVLCPHGHWADGRLHDHDPRGSVVARCLQLARMGAVVFTYDMVGYNDSCQLPHREFRNDRHLGMSLMALQTWNSIRAIDFLCDLPDVDSRRIGVTGASGGGTQTFALAAVDPRVSACAPICMISYHMQGGCLCENAPLLRIGATSVDIARLFAPKPMLMGSCTTDWTKNTADEELPAVRRIYELYGATDRLHHRHVDDQHNYNQDMQEHVCGFFNRYLFGADSAGPVPETAMARPPHRDRMVWWGRPAPPASSAQAFKRLWRERVDQALRPYRSRPARVKEELCPLLPHTVGVTPTSLSDCRGRAPHHIALTRSGARVTVAPARALPAPQEEVRFFEAYNRTAFAEQVHEIAAATAMVRGPVHLVGVDAAGPACLVAAALCPRVASIEADMCGFDPGKPGDWGKLMDAPCLIQIGGLATVFAGIGSRPITLHRATGSVQEARRGFAH